MIPASLFALIGSRCLAGCPRGRFPDSTDGFYARLPGGYLCRGVLPRLRLGPFLRGCSAPGPVRLPGGSRPPYPQQPWSGGRGEVGRFARSAHRPAARRRRPGCDAVWLGEWNNDVRQLRRTINCGLCVDLRISEKRNDGGNRWLGRDRAQRTDCVLSEISYKSWLWRHLRHGISASNN